MRHAGRIFAIVLAGCSSLVAGDLSTAVRSVSMVAHSGVATADIDGDYYFEIASLPLTKDASRHVLIKKLDAKFIKGAVFSQKIISSCKKTHEFLARELGRNFYHTVSSGVLFFKISEGKMQLIFAKWDGYEGSIGAKDLRDVIRIIRIKRPIPREIDDEINLAIKLMEEGDGSQQPKQKSTGQPVAGDVPTTKNDRDSKDASRR